MFAAVGDRLVVNGTHVGDPVRCGQVIGVRHDDGSPPYLVRWEDDGHESIYYPASDASVQHLARRRDG